MIFSPCCERFHHDCVYGLKKIKNMFFCVLKFGLSYQKVTPFAVRPNDDITSLWHKKRVMKVTGIMVDKRAKK